MREGNDVIVYSAVACPFSHRTRMALAIKDVPYETVEIDLLDPPEWFTAGPARTQMPRMETAETILHGASVVGEYIDERWPDPPLLPGSPAQRARAREWIHWLEVHLQAAYESALLEIDEAKYEALRVHLEGVLRRLEARLVEHRASGQGSRGPYWHGQRIGMVDLTYAPSLVRFAGLRRFHGWELPAGLPLLASWIETLRTEPLVRDTFFEEDVLRTVGGYLDNFVARARTSS